MAKEESKKCPKCKEGIASDAKKCKHCGADLRNWFVRHKVLSVILGLVVLVILGSALGGSGYVTKVDGDTETEQAVVYNIGDTINTGKLEITITKVAEKTSVGGEYFKETPSQGGTYVAVQYKVKNASDKPVSAWFQSSFNLVDSNGTEYESDIGASSSYATEVGQDEKILSDLNPGITVNGADVYEINKESYSTGKWYLVVSADGKDYKIAVK